MSPNTFTIEGLGGKKRLKGAIPVYGAKNHGLKMMAAALLIPGESRFTNVPDISDVASMARILEGMGAFVSRERDALSVNAKDLSGTVLNQELAKSMRASIVLIGPILARLGSVTFPHPGGDVIGERPIDIFISGFQKLGAAATESGGTYTLSAPNGLSGGEFFFRIVSVTATESLMMAATLAKGPVTLKNCAMEPEIVALGEFLKSCGAKIDGTGTPTIHIQPSVLNAATSPAAIIPDRIEAATFLALGALAAEELTITGIEPAHMDAVLDMLGAMGVPLSVSKNVITVRSPENIHPVKLRTHEYPGFPTDAQAPMTVVLTQAEGESVIYETIFDGRLNYTSELVRMGADIQIMTPHRAVIKGKTPLKGADISTPDIRAGLAFILAAAAADGTSHVGNAHLIDRGYAEIEKRLAGIGLAISRT
ncbi:UDP-N-acetylglucosamine 1-carboxyvinyltransferase [Candidatus Kaiserbacteria bacterium]|nr:UDP-N-acetylglucosamine 1-carboxyvinyltransferase [Candidatus Kaiserbacteria bacterium]